MSRFSVAGTDEVGDTVKVESEHTNQTHERVKKKNTYINYSRALSIDTDGMVRTKTDCTQVKKARCRLISIYDVRHRSRAILVHHHPGR